MLRLYNLGSICLAAKDYECSVTHYEQVVRVDSSFYQAWQNLALAYDHLGRHLRAHPCHEQALKLGPHGGFRSRVLVNYALSLMDAYGLAQQHVVSRVLDALREAVVQDGSNENAIFTLGKTYFSTQQHRLAEETFKGLLALNPHNHMALLNLGNQLFLQRDYEGAEVYFRRAIAEGTHDKKVPCRAVPCRAVPNVSGSEDLMTRRRDADPYTFIPMPNLPKSSLTLLIISTDRTGAWLTPTWPSV